MHDVGQKPTLRFLRPSLQQGAGRQCGIRGCLRVVSVIVSWVPWGVVDEKGDARRAEDSLHAYVLNRRLGKAAVTSMTGPSGAQGQCVAQVPGLQRRGHWHQGSGGPHLGLRYQAAHDAFADSNRATG